MKDDDIAVLFCNPKTAEKLLAEDEDIRDSLVVTTLLSEDEVIMVEQDEFLKWLMGEET